MRDIKCPWETPKYSMEGKWAKVRERESEKKLLKFIFRWLKKFMAFRNGKCCRQWLWKKFFFRLREIFFSNAFSPSYDFMLASFLFFAHLYAEKEEVEVKLAENWEHKKINLLWGQYESFHVELEMKNGCLIRQKKSKVVSWLG